MDTEDLSLAVCAAQQAATCIPARELLRRKPVKAKAEKIADVKQVDEHPVMLRIPNHVHRGIYHQIDGQGGVYYSSPEREVIGLLALLEAEGTSLTTGRRVIVTRWRPRDNRTLAALEWREIPRSLTAPQLQLLDTLLRDGTSLRDAFEIASNPAWL